MENYYNSHYSANVLKIRSRGFDRAQYCNVNQILVIYQQFYKNNYLIRTNLRAY